MSQAVVDPNELRRFAQALKMFNSELQERQLALTNQFNALSETWRDQEQHKFSEQFEEHMKGIARLIDVTDQYVPVLVRKASHIEEYLNSR